MNKLCNICFVILAVVLFGHPAVQAAQPLAETMDAVFIPLEEENGQQTHPFAQPNLFNVYHPVESGTSVSNIPAPFLSAEEREKSAVHRFIISAEENWATVYLQIYHFVDRSPLLLKYIYPFHAFL